jgi:hypothetical protein
VSDAHLKTSASCGQGLGVSTRYYLLKKARRSAGHAKYTASKDTHPPEGIDATLGRDDTKGNHVRGNEDDGCKHAEQHDAEARARADEFDDCVFVVLVDDEHKLDGREDPPRISTRDEQVLTCQMGYFLQTR